MALRAQELGSFSTATTTAAPSSDTDGFACYGARYINAWCQTAGGAGAMWQTYIYLYRTGIGWVYYRDVPQQIALYSSTNGGLIEFEVRGAERIYFRVFFVESAPTANVLLEGFTYR